MPAFMQHSTQCSGPPAQLCNPALLPPTIPPPSSLPAMSYPTTQAAFHPHPSATRPPSTSTSTDAPSYATAYRSIHGPRLSLPYQSSYQRDYAAVEEYMRLQREKEATHRREEAALGGEDGEEEEEGVKYSSEVEEEEEEGRDGALSGDDELAEEMKASSTFLPSASPSPPSSPPRHRSPPSPSSAYSHSSSLSSSSTPVSPSPSTRRPLSSSSFHPPSRPHSSVPPLPLPAWPASHPHAPLLANPLHTSSLASTPPISFPPPPPLPAPVGDRDSDWRPSRRRAPPNPYIIDPITGRYTTLPSLPLPSSSSSSFPSPSSFSSSSSSSSSPSSFPPSSLPSSSQSSAYPSREGSLGGSGEGSPVWGARRRGVSGRIDPASVPFAAGVPSHREWGVRGGVVGGEAGGYVGVGSGQATPVREVRERGRGRASVPAYAAYLAEEGRERGRGRKGGERRHVTSRPHADVLHVQAEREVEEEEVEEQLQGEADATEKAEQEERVEQERKAKEAEKRHRHAATQRQERQLHHHPTQPSHPPSHRGHLAQDADRLIAAVQAKRDRHDHPPPPAFTRRPAHTSNAAASLPPPVPALPLPSLFSLPSSTLLHQSRGVAAFSSSYSATPFEPHYGYEQLTPGSIERQMAAERAAYELELKRIREDPSNRDTRHYLRERMQRTRDVI